MVEPHHRIETQQQCDVRECKEPAERSIATKRAEGAGLSLGETVGKSAHLCKHHYREFKKKTKKDRELDKLGW
jgi:hypothetical protein